MSQKTSPRKFFRTTIVVQVLSEDAPIEFDDLSEVDHMITGGDCSGIFKVLKSERVEPKAMARMLMKQGSEPEFFGLDSKGCDVEE
jgi:hypothetical protein